MSEKSNNHRIEVGKLETRLDLATLTPGHIKSKSLSVDSTIP